jgi:hypothetical protein
MRHWLPGIRGIIAAHAYRLQIAGLMLMPTAQPAAKGITHMSNQAGSPKQEQNAQRRRRRRPAEQTFLTAQSRGGVVP